MNRVEQIIADLCVVPNAELEAVSLNRLADHYRNGGDLRTLIPLLTHEDPEVVSGAAWIAAEVVDSQRGREIFEELAQLLGHDDPAVRFGVIASVAQLVTVNERGTLQQLRQLTEDENLGVRQQAFRYIAVIEAKEKGSERE